jgi:hypothetical protein
MEAVRGVDPYFAADDVVRDPAGNPAYSVRLVDAAGHYALLRNDSTVISSNVAPSLPLMLRNAGIGPYDTLAWKLLRPPLSYIAMGVGALALAGVGYGVYRWIRR